jgi:hypothetical protein
LVIEKHTVRVAADDASFPARCPVTGTSPETHLRLADRGFAFRSMLFPWASTFARGPRFDVPMSHEGASRLRRMRWSYFALNVLAIALAVAIGMSLGLLDRTTRMERRLLLGVVYAAFLGVVWLARYRASPPPIDVELQEDGQAAFRFTDAEYAREFAERSTAPASSRRPA